jgi:hypothetical protein
MNEMTKTLPLAELMQDPIGWGRAQGREVYPRLLDYVERNQATVFKVSFEGVRRFDYSFASETIVELARRFRRLKAFCVVDLDNEDLIENLDVAAEKKEQPLVIWHQNNARLLGLKPSEGLRDAFQFAMARGQTRAAAFAMEKEIPIANASMKFKQLWEQGFLLRRESTADSGGVEFIYCRIG